MPPNIHQDPIYQVLIKETQCTKPSSKVLKEAPWSTCKSADLTQVRSSRKNWDRGLPSQIRVYPQHSQSDTLWNDAERAPSARPRNVEGAVAAWERDQLPQGREDKDMKHIFLLDNKNHVRQSRRGV